jgi:hypothetical protein
MRQSTADIMPGGSEPWTWWPRFGPADGIPTARQPSDHHWVLNTCQDIEMSMSIALPYHAWFVGHQTECPVSAGRFLTLNVLHGSKAAVRAVEWAWNCCGPPFSFSNRQCAEARSPRSRTPGPRLLSVPHGVGVSGLRMVAAGLKAVETLWCRVRVRPLARKKVPRRRRRSPAERAGPAFPRRQSDHRRVGIFFTVRDVRSDAEDWQGRPTPPQSDCPVIGTGADSTERSQPSTRYPHHQAITHPPAFSSNSQ